MYVCLFEIEVKGYYIFALVYNFLLSLLPLGSVCSCFWSVSIPNKGYC